MCMNCGKTIGFLLDNQKIENFIAPFVANMMFRNFGLSWIIEPNKKLNYYVQLHFDF